MKLSEELRACNDECPPDVMARAAEALDAAEEALDSAETGYAASHAIGCPCVGCKQDNAIRAALALIRNEASDGR